MHAPLNASATTMGTLLSGSIFEIPAYQREFAWQKSEVSEFWNDLSLALSLGPYFLGLIIVTGEEKRKQVVDGQQRLLTVTLLAAAVRHEALIIGRKALADRIHSTLLRSMDYATDEVLPRIILTDARANDTLQSIIEDDEYGEVHSGTPGSSSNRLLEAYRYLRKSLRGDDPEDIFRRLGTWAEFINEQLYVAVFEHPDEASAYSVFEVVNTRGRQLTTADLLKNYILRQTPVESREDRHKQWQRMVEQFEQIGSQGFVQYIRHAVNLEAGYILPKDLYNYISNRGHFIETEISVDDLMFALKERLALYLQLADPTIEGPADEGALKVFVALNELGITAVRPLILAIFLTGVDDATSGMLEVLRLVVKRIVVGNLGASSVERKFADAARVVYSTGSWREGIDLLAEMNHPRDEFVAQLTRRSYNRGVLTFMRRSIINESATPDSIGTLQYLRPRQGSGSWTGFSDEDVTFWGSTLGNTILVDLDRRPRGANTWLGVQQHLLVHAVSGEKLDMLKQHERWTPDAVEAVGAELAEAAANVWY